YRILNDIFTVWTLKLERLALEPCIIQTIVLCTQHRRVSHFSIYRHERKSHGLKNGIRSRPALAPACVLAIAEQREAGVDPGIRNCVDQLFMRPAQHSGQDRSAGDAGHLRMVYARLVEIVFHRETALYFVGLYQCLEYVQHHEWLAACSAALTAQKV